MYVFFFNFVTGKTFFNIVTAIHNRIRLYCLKKKKKNHNLKIKCIYYDLTIILN